MATKKQKRAAALAKREEFMAEVAASGLAAQNADKQAREKRAKELQAAAQAVNEKYEGILRRELKKAADSIVVSEPKKIERLARKELVSRARNFGNWIGRLNAEGNEDEFRRVQRQWVEFRNTHRDDHPGVLTEMTTAYYKEYERIYKSMSNG